MQTINPTDSDRSRIHWLLVDVRNGLRSRAINAQARLDVALRRLHIDVYPVQGPNKSIRYQARCEAHWIGASGDPARSRNAAIKSLLEWMRGPAMRHNITIPS